MKQIKFSLLIFSLLLLSFLSLKTVNAQMMGNYYQGENPPSQADLQDEQNMQNAGLQVYQNLKSGKITCSNLTNDDYEKLGEYFMGQSAGSVQNHVYWDNMIQRMMGDNGDTQVHIAWGERGSGCFSSSALPSNTTSFINGMMGGYGPNGNANPNYGFPMMGFGANGEAFWIFPAILYLLLLANLLLLGVWLLKSLRSKTNNNKRTGTRKK